MERADRINPTVRIGTGPTSIENEKHSFLNDPILASSSGFGRLISELFRGSTINLRTAVSGECFRAQKLAIPTSSVPDLRIEPADGRFDGTGDSMDSIIEASKVLVCGSKSSDGNTSGRSPRA